MIGRIVAPPHRAAEQKLRGVRAELAPLLATVAAS